MWRVQHGREEQELEELLLALPLAYFELLHFIFLVAAARIGIQRCVAAPASFGIGRDLTGLEVRRLLGAVYVARTEAQLSAASLYF